MLRRAALLSLALTALAAPVAHAVPQTFDVTLATDEPDQTLDGTCAKVGGGCTLRAAIEESNNNSDHDTITFSIGTGAQTITLGSALPVISDSVSINADTQDGFDEAPLITVKGTGTSGFDGFVISDSTLVTQIQYVVMVNFETAILVLGSADIFGSHIGIDGTGAAAAQTANDVGIDVDAGAFNTRIGELASVDPALRNVISNNRIGVKEARADQVYGNYIGTDPTGTLDRGNSGPGLQVSDCATVIGNVISGNGGNGLEYEGTSGCFISFNKVGTDVTGSFDIGNDGDGVLLTAPIDDFTGNVIAGNGAAGVRIDAGGSGSELKDNMIGVGGDGATPIPNDDEGVFVNASDLRIGTVGGSFDEHPNVIAHNGGDGITIASGTGNLIRRNFFLANGGLGIDLNADGVTENDGGDGDGGANGSQNFPVLTGATEGGDVTGTINTQTGPPVRIDVFANAACDPSGNGEGQERLGSVEANTDGSGNGSFTFRLPDSVAAGEFVTTLASFDDNRTSEFSDCLEVVAAAPGNGGSGDGPAVVPPAFTPPALPPIVAPPALNREPDSAITRVRSQRRRKLRAFRGTASDADGNLARVEIALVATKGGATAAATRRRFCLRLRTNGRLRRTRLRRGRTCPVTAFLPARGTATWTFRLRRRLPKGTYVLYSRAVDTQGARETTFAAGDGNRVKFRLR